MATEQQEIERLRFRVLQLENEIVANLHGDLAILAESEHLTENALRAEAFSRYESAVQRWRDLWGDVPSLRSGAMSPGGDASE